MKEEGEVIKLSQNQDRSISILYSSTSVNLFSGGNLEKLQVPKNTLFSSLHVSTNPHNQTILMILSPSQGLIVYDLTNKKVELT